ncbi:unnamed protein product [Cylicostephanus goldi]|uniref:glucuronosyltransferase n=1 Tax=Cylicostephanus goldi TaxID=71465 RepID=A0A3P6S667_CYLGO|nr:unnamed protein product [Cylicostephanus goldi]
MQEAISAGVPVIAIPLFGDQPKNARLAEHHGFAVRISKTNVKAESVAEALTKILNDQRYMVTSRIWAKSQLSECPFQLHNGHQADLQYGQEKASQRFSFIGVVDRTLENLVPAGNRLNFVQYHSIDVVVTIMACFVILMYIMWKLLIFLAFKVVALVNGEKPKKE